MSQELSPFHSEIAVGFASDELPASPLEAIAPGQFQVVHFIVPGNWLDMFVRRINVWFQDRDEIIFVASGQSAMGLGFIVLEWEECQVDRLFLKILEQDELVSDFYVYIREGEVE